VSAICRWERSNSVRLQFTLEPGDLLTDRGLDDVQPLRGLAEMAQLGNGDEVLQLPNVHLSPPVTDHL